MKKITRDIIQKAWSYDDYRTKIDELFEVGKEIITYKNLADLKTKIDYYLNPKNEKERINIANAGYQRAIKEHTYEIRLNQLLKIINES